MDENKLKGQSTAITTMAQITKAFADTVKMFEKTDKAAVKKSVAVFSDISKYLKVFLQGTREMMDIVNEFGADAATKESIKAAADMVKVIESSVKVIEMFGNVKLPGLIKTRLKLWKFRLEFGMVLDMFFNENNGIAKIILAFDKPSDIVVKDEKGNEKVVHTSNIANLKTAIANINDMLDGINVILSKTQKICLYALMTYPIIKIGLKLLTDQEKGIFPLLIQMMDTEGFKKFMQPETTESIGHAIESVMSLARFFGALQVMLGNIDMKLIMRANFVSKQIKPLLQKLTVVINSIAEWTKTIKSDIDKDVVEQISIIKDIVDSLLSVVKGILLLALASVVLMPAVLLAEVSLFAIRIFLSTVKWTLKPLNNARFTTEMVMSCKNLVRIVTSLLASMLIVSVGLILLGALGYKLASMEIFKQIAIVFGIVTLFIVAAAGLAWLISWIFGKAKVTDKIWFGLLLILAIIGLMLVVGASLFLFAWLGESLWDQAGNIGKAFLIILIVLAGIGILGMSISWALPAFISAALVVTLTAISITMIILILAQLKLLAFAFREFTEEEQARIKSNVKLTINTALDIITAMFFDDEGLDDKAKSKNQKTKNSPFRRFFSSIFKGSAMFIEALASSAILVFTVISLAMIMLINLEMRLIATMKVPDRTAVGKNIRVIMGAAQDCINAIFFADDETPEKETPDNWFKPLLNKIFKGLGDIIVIILSVVKVLVVMVAIGMILLIEQELKLLTTTKVDREAVARSVRTIMGTADECIDAIFNSEASAEENNPGGKKFLNFVKRVLGGIGDVVETVIGIGKVAVSLVAIGMVVFLAESLKIINDIQLNKKTIMDNTDIILNATDEIIKKVFNEKSDIKIDDKKINKFNALTQSLSGFIKVFDVNVDKVKTGIEETIRFVDKIDKANIENLQTATNMFEKMAEFSNSINGNFEGLADTINEKIIPLLEKLNEALEKTNSGIDNIGSDIGSGTENNPELPRKEIGTPTNPKQQKEEKKPTYNYKQDLSDIKKSISGIEEYLRTGVVTVTEKVTKGNY